MRIKIGTKKDPEWTTIDVGSHEILVQDCFCGIVIETDTGLYGVAQRDGGVEILHNGELVWSSSDHVSTK